MNNLLKIVVSILFVFISMPVNAAYVKGIDTTIKSVSAYGHGAVIGDFVITVTNIVAGCEAGYYVKNDNPGKNSILSIALSAYHAKSTVQVHGYDSPRWAGSSANYCETEGIHLQ